MSLITRLDSKFLGRYAEDTPVYFAVLVEVKDLMAASPDAIPASARAALELCESRQSRLTSKIPDLGLTSNSAIERFKKAQRSTSSGPFSFKSQGKIRYDEVEIMLSNWKSSIMLLRSLAVEDL